MLSSRTAAYRTRYGTTHQSDARQLLARLADNSVQLVLTSPPFALQRPKAYGNPTQDQYSDWLAEFAVQVRRTLTPDGSLVLDLGGAYQAGQPVRSLHNYRVLLRLCDELGFYLAEDFYWYNPARLPGPAEWVNKRKLRAKDAVDTVWWLAKSPWPKADVTRVRVPYSRAMRRLLQSAGRYYRPRQRPSGHRVGKGFASDHGDALPSNLLSFPNTESNSRYLQSCRTLGIRAHLARFPARLPAFFIEMLTEPGDWVVDIFAGSNTTGAVAEGLKRRWLGFEIRHDYLAASALRFLEPGLEAPRLQAFYRRLLTGRSVDLRPYLPPLPTVGKKTPPPAAAPESSPS